MVVYVVFQEKYIEVASELIVYTYFFYASEDILTKVIPILFYHLFFMWLLSLDAMISD